MKLLFIMKTGGSISWEVPEADREAFSYHNVVGAIRRDGFFQSNDLHIRYESTEAICFVVGDGASPLVQGMTRQ